MGRNRTSADFVMHDSIATLLLENVQPRPGRGSWQLARWSPRRSAGLAPSGRRQGMAETMAKQAARTVGSQLGRQILRGVLGGVVGGSRRR